MLATQAKISEQPTPEKEESISFTPQELKIFVEEVKEMSTEGKIIDLPKAIHNARYFAEVDRRIANVKAGNWTEHELTEVDEDE